MNDHILLCGLGKVGFSILELLHSLGEPVVVIARDVDPDWARRAEAMADRLILKDMRDDNVLLEADIESARAVIAATNDDLANLEVALDARRLAPKAAVVLRVHDATLAERVRRDMDVRAVLNSAELSAPAFVAAALGDRIVRAFDVENAFVHIVTFSASGRIIRPGETLRELAARLNVIPLAVRAADTGHRLAPSLDLCLEPGDEVVVAASHPTVRDLTRSGGAPFGSSCRETQPESRRLPVWVRPRVHPLAIIRHIWNHASAPLRYAFVAIHVLMLLSVVIFHFSRELSWIDSFYFTVSVMTTVGFGDINLLHDAPALKLFGCLLMISGAALLVVFYGIVTSYLLSLRFEHMLGTPRTTLSDHIVIIGLGKLGSRVAARLHELGEPVLAVERNTDSAIMMQLPEDIPVVRSDAEQPHVMEQAGVARARALVAVTDDDMVNLRAAHEAEQLNPRIRTVVRLFHSSLANKLGSRVLGIDQPLNPSQAAAATFVACALAPDVLQGFTLGGRLLLLREMDTAQCAGRTVGDLRENAGILVLLRKPSGAAIMSEVGIEDVIAEGDRLVVLEEYRPAERAAAPCSLVLFREPVPNV
jgi:Trk K+ transport system NAD-binding subunit